MNQHMHLGTKQLHPYSIHSCHNFHISLPSLHQLETYNIHTVRENLKHSTMLEINPTWRVHAGNASLFRTSTCLIKCIYKKHSKQQHAWKCHSSEILHNMQCECQLGLQNMHQACQPICASLASQNSIIRTNNRRQIGSINAWEYTFKKM